jgi:hypothetical protein
MKRRALIERLAAYTATTKCTEEELANDIHDAVGVRLDPEALESLDALTDAQLAQVVDHCEAIVQRWQSKAQTREYRLAQALSAEPTPTYLEFAEQEIAAFLREVLQTDDEAQISRLIEEAKLAFRRGDLDRWIASLLPSRFGGV